MAHPAARILGALELLQSHGRISGAELARRLGVDVRTVRRYVRVLDELGIPIVAEPGRHGGYGLVAGFKLPPMMFTDDEALALSIGLLAARGLGFATGPAGAGLASARAKLERVMPEGLRRRVRAADETMVLDLPAAGPPVDAGALALLSEAAQSERAVRLGYRAADGSASERRLDPYGLAFRGGHWYVTGHCHLRAGVRSFRVDRVVSVRRLDAGFTRPRGFDVLAELTAAIAGLPRAHSAEVHLRTDLPTAKRQIFAALGRLEPAMERAGGVLLHTETDDLGWLARELARLPFEFEIRRPAALRRALAAHLGRLAGAARREYPARPAGSGGAARRELRSDRNESSRSETMSTRKGAETGGKKISRGAAGELNRKAGRRAPERAAHASSPKTKKPKK